MLEQGHGIERRRRRVQPSQQWEDGSAAAPGETRPPGGTGTIASDAERLRPRATPAGVRTSAPAPDRSLRNQAVDPDQESREQDAIPNQARSRAPRRREPARGPPRSRPERSPVPAARRESGCVCGRRNHRARAGTDRSCRACDLRRTGGTTRRTPRSTTPRRSTSRNGPRAHRTARKECRSFLPARSRKGPAPLSAPP